MIAKHEMNSSELNSTYRPDSTTAKFFARNCVCEMGMVAHERSVDVCDVTLSMHPHRASWNVCLATVGIEPATFGILVQCSANWATCWLRATCWATLNLATSFASAVSRTDFYSLARSKVSRHTHNTSQQENSIPDRTGVFTWYSKKWRHNVNMTNECKRYGVTLMTSKNTATYIYIARKKHSLLFIFKASNQHFLLLQNHSIHWYGT